MPAAAVIPAPIAYIKVVAVKKLVVEILMWSTGLALCRDGLCCAISFLVIACLALSCWAWQKPSFTVKKLECSKQTYVNEYISME